MSAYDWVMILICIFIIGLMYMIGSQILYSNIRPMVDTALAASTSNTTMAKNALSVIDTAWEAFPIICIIGLIIVGFVSAQRRDPNEYMSS